MLLGVRSGSLLSTAAKLEAQGGIEDRWQPGSTALDGLGQDHHGSPGVTTLSV